MAEELDVTEKLTCLLDNFIFHLNHNEYDFVVSLNTSGTYTHDDLNRLDILWDRLDADDLQEYL